MIPNGWDRRAIIALSVFDCRYSGRAAKGQMSITHLVEVERSRRSGNQMVSALEFRERGLRDATELLENLKRQSPCMGLGLALGLSRDSDQKNSGCEKVAQR